MIEFKDVRVSRQVFERGNAFPFVYFEDDKQRDWYEVRDSLWKGVNNFIAVDENDIVITWSTDPNFLSVKQGVSIFEVEVLPEDLHIKTYKYQSGLFIETKSSFYEKPESQKKTLLNMAMIALAPLQDAVDLNIATEEEIALLNAWKKYRVLLNRIDTSTAPNISWPEKPY